MTDYEIYKKTDEIVGSTEVNTKQKTKMCMYKLNGGERFCKATTNKSCKACHFFTPSMSAKMKLLTQNIIEKEEFESRQEKRIKILDGYIDDLFQDNNNLRERLVRQHRRERLLKRKYRREKEKLGRKKNGRI